MRTTTVTAHSAADGRPRVRTARAARGRLPAAVMLMALVAAAVVVPASSAGAAVTGAPQRGPSVTRVEGPARADTAAALARATTTDPAVVYLAAGSDFADGLAAGAAAARTGGVVLLVDADGLPTATARALEDLDGTPVVVVGGTARIPQTVAREVATVTGRVPVRVAGADRYATAADLARSVRASRNVDHVWLVSGVSAADALGAGAATAPTDGALLTTPSDRLAPATRAALRDLSPRAVTVVGGPAAVAPRVVDEVEAVLGAQVPVRRLGGQDRYATSAVVARTVFGTPRAAVVATGRAWADALAATPLAAARDGAVVLAPRRCLTASVADVLVGTEAVVVAGGEAALSPRVAQLSPCADEITTVTAAELGASWRPGCPVVPAELRRVTVDHYPLDGTGIRVGHLVVHRSVAVDVVRVFDDLFTARFPLRRVTSVDDYGGDDDAAMAANATTAFNCRTVAGTGTWSQHAYGTAIDINPVQNPYVSSGGVWPAAGAAYVTRSAHRPGMVREGGPAVRAFTGRGWGWGGRWRSVKDYQHFSRTGR